MNVCFIAGCVGVVLSYPVPSWIPRQWQPGFLSSDLFPTNSSSIQQDLMPAIGNGFVATLVDAGVGYGAGMYTYKAAGHATKPSAAQHWHIGGQQSAAAVPKARPWSERKGSKLAGRDVEHHDSTTTLGIPLPLIAITADGPRGSCDPGANCRPRSSLGWQANQSMLSALDVKNGAFYRLYELGAGAAGDAAGRGPSGSPAKNHHWQAAVPIQLSARRYVHAMRPSILVLEVNATNAGSGAARLWLNTTWGSCAEGATCNVSVEQFQRGQTDPDQDPWPTAVGVTRALQAEWTGLQPCTAVVVADSPPAGTSVQLSPGETRRMVFLTAVATSAYNLTGQGAAGSSSGPAARLEASARSAMQAARQAGPSALWQEHAAGWAAHWEDGSISIEGDPSLASAVNASLYAIYLSLRGGVREGISPGSLATPSYNGNRFWDMDTWMFPPLALLRRDDLAAGLLQYRQNTLPGAEYKAAYRGYEGAMWPWQSAGTGFECQPYQEGYYENHVSGDVAVAHEQMMGLLDRGAGAGTAGSSSLVPWLRGAWPLINATASYWMSRVSPMALPPLFPVDGAEGVGGDAGSDIRIDSAATGEQLWPDANATVASSRSALPPRGSVAVLDVHEVMPPDEIHWPVNSSAYTNAVAARSLVLGAAAAKVLQMQDNAPVALWLDAARRLGVLYNASSQIHPEFLGWTDRDKAKQADVVMLGFPLQWLGLGRRPGSQSADLRYYVNHTIDDGPAMTYAMFAVGWLDLGRRDLALDLFRRGYANVHLPFNVWRETPTGGAQQFVTGAGGFLQSVLMGYGGLRIRAPDPESGSLPQPGVDWFAQAPPPAPASRITMRGVDVGGCSLRLTVEGATGGGGGVSAEEESPCAGGRVVKLAPWVSPRGSGQVLPARGPLGRYRLDLVEATGPVANAGGHG